jgi:hypothetical protein
MSGVNTTRLACHSPSRSTVNVARIEVRHKSKQWEQMDFLIWERQRLLEAFGKGEIKTLEELTIQLNVLKVLEPY